MYECLSDCRSSLVSGPPSPSPRTRGHGQQQMPETRTKKFLPKSDCTSDHALTGRSRSTTAGVRQSSKRMIIIWDSISMSDKTGPTDPIQFHGVMIPLYHGIPLFGHCPFSCELVLSLEFMPDVLANNRKGKGQTSRSPMQPPRWPACLTALPNGARRVRETRGIPPALFR